MTSAIVQSSQIGVTLSLTVVKDNRVMTLPLANLTPVFVWLWSIWQEVNALVTLTAKHAARLVFTVEIILRRLKIHAAGWLLDRAYMPVGVG